MSKSIKMLKPGSFKAMNGHVYPFTSIDLQETAAAYDPALFAAPFVKGHPDHDAPRFGELAKVEFDGQHLTGVPDKVVPAFREEVNSGQFPYVSLSLYGKNHPDNPVPGVYYPRHLGFLGAMPPAVKGLGQVSLSEESTGIINLCAKIEFGDWNDRLVYRVLRGLKSLLTDQIGKEKVDAVVSEWDMECLLENAVTPETQQSAEAAFSESGKEHDMDAAALAAEKAKLDQREEQLKKREADMNADAAKRKRAEIASFVEEQIKGGRVLAADRKKEEAILCFLEGIAESDVIELGEGDAKKTVSVAEAYRQGLTHRAKVIELGELAGGMEPGTQSAAKPANLTRLV